MAKGLEFRSVVVMACDDDVIPLQARIEQVGDDADLKEVYDTERHLLYVACSRARDHLLVTGGESLLAQPPPVPEPPQSFQDKPPGGDSLAGIGPWTFLSDGFPGE